MVYSFEGKKTTTIDKAHEHKHTHIQVKRCTIEKKKTFPISV